jgi:hypothetical protein
MHKQKERQTDGKIGRNTNRQMVKWAGIQTDRESVRQSQTGRETDRQTNSKAERQTDRRTDRLTDQQAE